MGFRGQNLADQIQEVDPNFVENLRRTISRGGGSSGAPPVSTGGLTDVASASSTSPIANTKESENDNKDIKHDDRKND